MEELSDEQLVVLAVRKDQAALEILVRRYLGLVYALTYRYLADKDEAEDVTQEVFVKVWRNLSKFDQTRVFKPWLYQIAKRTCLDWLKKKRALSFSELEGDDGSDWLAESIADSSPLADEVVDQELLKQKLAQTTGQLPSAYSRVIWQHHGQDLSLKEIAKATGDSINTIKSRYRRALLKLRRILGE
jgi:RNA polymerase sigma-70 factor (ECF subfamily)